MIVLSKSKVPRAYYPDVTFKKGSFQKGLGVAMGFYYLMHTFLPTEPCFKDTAVIEAIIKSLKKVCLFGFSLNPKSLSYSLRSHRN